MPLEKPVFRGEDEPGGSSEPLVPLGITNDCNPVESIAVRDVRPSIAQKRSQIPAGETRSELNQHCKRRRSQVLKALKDGNEVDVVPRCEESIDVQVQQFTFFTKIKHENLYINGAQMRVLVTEVGGSFLTWSRQTPCLQHIRAEPSVGAYSQDEDSRQCDCILPDIPQLCTSGVDR